MDVALVEAFVAGEAGCEQAGGPGQDPVAGWSVGQCPSLDESRRPLGGLRRARRRGRYDSSPATVTGALLPRAARRAAGSARSGRGYLPTKRRCHMSTTPSLQST